MSTGIAGGVRSARTSPRLGAVGAGWVPWAGFAALALVATALILYLTRGTTLWFDDWVWALYRRSGAHSLLASYAGHFSIVPVLIYRALYATTGIGSYLPFRVLIAFGNVLCGLVVFSYARRRVGPGLGLLAAALILFLGPGWQNMLWPFQIAWLISIAAGLGALMLLERRDRLGDAGACLLLLVSVASTSVGVAMLIGAIIDVAWVRRRWVNAWIVAIPAVIYLAWSIGYQDTQLAASHIFAVPHWAASSAAAAASTLTGLSGQSPSDNSGSVLEFGIPIALAGAVAVAWRIRRFGPPPARAVSLAAIAFAFWGMTAIGRAFFTSPYDSRYEYVDAVIVLLFAVELTTGLPRRRWLDATVVLAGLAALLSNIGVLRDAGGYLRSQAPVARGDLAALDIARPLVSADHVAGSFPGYPFVVVRAGAYFAMEAAIGTPAYTPAQLPGAPAAARAVADAELAPLDRVEARASNRAAPPGAGPLPRVDSAVGAVVAARPPCLLFRPSAVSAAGSQLTVTVPPGGLWIDAADGAGLAVRRFADAPHPLTTIGQGPVELAPAADRAPQPWHLLLQSSHPAVICGG